MPSTARRFRPVVDTLEDRWTPAAGSLVVGAAYGPTVEVYSATGSHTRTIAAFEPGFTGGVRVATGDLTGDGIPDVVAGSGPGRNAEVRVFDGVTGALVGQAKPFGDGFTGGVYVAAGDLTGDGIADVVVTPDQGGGPRVVVYRGGDLSTVASFFGIDDPKFRGGARPAIGDLNGDGIADLVVGAGFGGGPRLAGFEGRSVVAGQPTRLFSDFFAFEPALRNGTFPAVGDLNGDGAGDLIIGGGPGGGPRVIGISGRELLDGQRVLLANFYAGPTFERNGVPVAAGDLDADGRAEIVAGSGATARVYLGSSIVAGGRQTAAFEITTATGAGSVYVGATSTTPAPVPPTVPPPAPPTVPPPAPPTVPPPAPPTVPPPAPPTVPPPAPPTVPPPAPPTVPPPTPPTVPPPAPPTVPPPAPPTVTTPLQIVEVRTRAEFQSAMNSATPGTEIRMHPGTYSGGMWFGNLQGTADHPIVITAIDANNPPVIQGGYNGIQFSDIAYFQIRNLVFDGATGNGLNIDDFDSYDTPSHHITLAGLTVRNIGTGGNHDGIKLSGVEQFTITGCTLLNWGTGGSGIDMVGCHDGLITNSLFRHTHPAATNGLQAKGGSIRVTVRDNRFENAGVRAVQIGGYTDLEYFRPQPVPGYEAKDVTVEGNVIIGSEAAVAFVNTDGAVVRFNTIYHPSRWVFRILQERTESIFVPSRNGVVTDNIIAFSSTQLATAVNVGAGTAPETFQFARNWWYCTNAPSLSTPSLPTTEIGGVYGTDPMFIAPGSGDLHLQPDSPAINYGAYSPLRG